MNWHLFWTIVQWVYLGIAIFNIIVLSAIWDPSFSQHHRWSKILLMGVLWPVFAIAGLVVIFSDFYMPDFRDACNDVKETTPNKEKTQ